MSLRVDRLTLVLARQGARRPGAESAEREQPLLHQLATGRRAAPPSTGTYTAAWPKYGRLTDNYEFHVMYSDPENDAPLDESG